MPEVRPETPAQPPRKPLLPPEVIAKLPAWRSTADQEDPIASVKLSLPGMGWTWYIVEYDGEDSCFGLVAGQEVEAGYFSLLELEDLNRELQARHTLARDSQPPQQVERDARFQPAHLSELSRHHRSQRAFTYDP